MLANIRSLIVLAAILCTLTTCNSGGSSEEKVTDTPPAATPTSDYSIELNFERVKQTLPRLDKIKVIATIKDNGKVVKDASPSISLGRGEASKFKNKKNGNYESVITPSQTGEHSVTVEYEGVSVTRTPIVLYKVHDDWAQPMAVSGYVNTKGYEDGVTITPDGEYLFVQTGPQYSSGTFVMEVDRAKGGCGGALNRLNPTRCSHKWIDTLAGPYTAPYRPGFFDGRYSGNQILHNANSWGVGEDQAPNYAVSTMFYGFKRQEDGTFKEPFYVAFNDENDAIASPFGLSFYLNNDGTAKTLFTWNNPSDDKTIDLDNDGNDDIESYFDVYHTTIILGQNNNLGNIEYSGTPGDPPVVGSYFPSKKVEFGDIGINGNAGTQGNSHIYAPGGVLKSIWTDDEYDSGGDHGEISVYLNNDAGNYNSTNWTKVQLPTNINVAGSSHEIQPFFNGTKLFFTRSGIHNPKIYSASYSGNHNSTDLTNNSHWSSPELIMEGESTTSLGRIVAVGEPTVAIRNGEEYLYFVYVILRDIDYSVNSPSGVIDLDFQAGWIKKN